MLSSSWQDIERINRTLMERVRAMLKDAKLEDNMWAEAVMTANYIRNRSPTSQMPRRRGSYSPAENQMCPA